jgi:hypothetical protein
MANHCRLLKREVDRKIKAAQLSGLAI